MKIAVLSPVTPPFIAPEADYTYQLCRNLVMQGHQVHLITTSGSKMKLDGCTVHDAIPQWGWRNAPRLVRTLLRIQPELVLVLFLGWIYENHPMVTFVPTWLNWFMPESRVGTIFFNKQGCNMWTASAQNLFIQKLWAFLSGSPNLIYEFGSLLQRSDRLYAFCSDHAEIFPKIYPNVKPRLGILPSLPLIEINAKLDRDQARVKLGIPTDQKVVSFFGYVYPSKGIEYLIRAGETILSQDPSVRIFVIGGVLENEDFIRKNYFHQMKQLTLKLGLQDKIQFTGSYTLGDPKPDLYLRSSDVFVFPFDKGIALNNSSVATVSQYGKPIVSTQPDHLERAFRPEENILLVPPKDPKALAEAILSALNDQTLKQQLSIGARSLSQSEFSWSRAIGRVLSELSLKHAHLS